MNNGDKRRSRRRQQVSRSYRVRYDRLVAAVLVLIVLIVIITTCIMSCSKDDKKSSDTSQQTTNNENLTKNTIVDDLRTSGETRAIIGSTDTETTTVPQFTTEMHSARDIHRGDLILVNELHEYSFESEDSELLTLYDHIAKDYYNVSDYVIKLDSQVIDQLNSLMEAFYSETGCDYLWVIGGYRTLEEQNDRYNNGQSRFQGGYSDYHTGRSFDLGIFPKDGTSSGYYTPTGDYAWFDEHAAEYGFIVRFPDGKDGTTGESARTQTYRYVGVPHAVYIKQNGLCLEEYISEVKTHSYDDPIEVTVDGKVYSVYYVAGSESRDTEVTVPANKTYTVSGNNSDGFIVTVELN